MYKQKFITGVALTLALVIGVQSTAAFAGAKKRQATFTVRVENISDKGGLVTVDGSKYPFAVSPGLYVVTEAKLDLFKVGKKADMGLEAQAEDGDPEALYNAIVAKHYGGSYGIFNTPVGANMPGPILPDGAYQFTFTATQGMRLNLAAMYGQSNDLFYAPAAAIALFDASGNPLSGDITREFLLWDAGTEVNQAPGIGGDQAPRQSMKNAGTPENGMVSMVKDGFTYPNTKDVLRITISFDDSSSKIKRVASPKLNISTLK